MLLKKIYSRKHSETKQDQVSSGETPDNLIRKGKALQMAMIQPDYNIVNLLCVIFSQGITQDNPSCKKFTRLLISRARSRGYRVDILPVFKEDRRAEEIVRKVADLASYICVNDLRDMFMSNRKNKPFVVTEISNQSLPASISGMTVH